MTASHTLPATFSPAVEVLTAQPAVLGPADLSYEGILGHFPGLADAEAVCLSGSIAAGWGNTFSDIDIYAFADHELVLPVDETMETWPGSEPGGIRWTNWMGRYGDARVDLQVWPTNAVRKALGPFLGDDEPEFANLSTPVEDFIYRVSIAVPLSNSGFIQELQDTITTSSYRRALARKHKARAENALTDVAGQVDSGDHLSARMSAVLAATEVADHCLILAGQLCPRSKWLLRRLATTPECGIDVDEYRSTVLNGARPGEDDRDCAMRIARWAQSHLIRVEDAVLTQS